MEVTIVVYEMIKAFLVIFMAEMGDKTQLLAMVFATQYPIKKVLAGIGIGAFLNHGLAVIIGYYLSNILPLGWLQIIAGICFIGFSLWSLSIEKEEEQKNENISQWGPIGTVALAFFIGELGDKTQLTAITLAAEGSYPLFVLAGTVSGMLGTGALGIWVGSKVGDKVPEIAMKIASSFLFLFFGVTKLYTNLSVGYVQPIILLIFICSIFLLYIWRLYNLWQFHKEQNLTVYKKAAAQLYESLQQIQSTINHICLGEGVCGTCQGTGCLVGYSKLLMEYAMEKKEYENIRIPFPKHYTVKTFDKDAVFETYTLTLYYLSQLQKEKSCDFVLHRVRQAMEMILFGTSFSYEQGYEKYIQEIQKINPVLSKRVFQAIIQLQKIA